MSALFPTPLTAPREFVGTVDATHERTTPCPRTLEQAFGRAAGGVIVPMAQPERMHRADRIVTVGSACAGLFVLVMLAAERWLA